MVGAPTASAAEPCGPTGTPWDQTEPHFEGASCYSEVPKNDIVPGTFVLLVDTSSTARNVVVARVIAVVSGQQSSALVRVNIFRQMKEVHDTEGILYPKVLCENHLRNLTEIVQTAELRVVQTTSIANLSRMLLIVASKTNQHLHGGYHTYSRSRSES